MKRYVWTLFGAVIVAGISLATWAGASNQGNKEALNAYKKMEQARNQKNKSLNESSNNFTLSDFAIPGALLSEADKISKYKGSNVHELLTAHGEKLSFIMEGDEVKGIAIATDTEPIMAGGEKTGPELFDLHEKIKNDLGDNVNLMYFSYAGGFVFVATDNKGEESLWLDQRAAQFLELSPHVQLDSEEVLQRIRNNINQ